MDKQMLSKRKLEIVKIHEDKPYGDGGKSLLPVNARDLSLPENSSLHGKSLRFVVFNPALVEFIKKLIPEDVLLADYEEQPSKNADYPNNLNIVQIYDDKGNPISVKKFGGGYNRGGKSPEEIASIETQVAVKVIFGYAAEYLKLGSPLGPKIAELLDLAADWCEKKLRYRPPPPKPEPAKPEPPRYSPERSTNVAKPNEPSQDKKEGVAKGEPTESLVKHAGNLMERAFKLDPPIKRDEVLTILSINDMKEITDLQAAWSSILEYHRGNQKETAEQGADKLFN